MTPRRDVRVLLVDDNPDHRFLTGRALRAVADELGLRVDVAEDGARALEACRDAARRPDVVLLDAKMPGLDGFDVLRELRADPATRALLVVLLTSSEHGADVKRAKELGADAYVTKPMDPRAFAAAVQEAARDFAAKARAR